MDGRLTMVVNCVVTDGQGNVTVRNILELHQMKLEDVLIMEKRLNNVVGSRLDEQLGKKEA